MDSVEPTEINAPATAVGEAPAHLSADDGRLTQLWVVIFPVFVSCCAIAYGTWRATVTWWLPRRYSVTTVAQNVGYKPSSDEDDPGVTVYSFTDTSGTRHTFDRAVPAGSPGMRIAYDPARPDFARGPGHPWTRTLILLIRLLLGVPITLAMVAYLLWYFTIATHAGSIGAPGCFHRNW